MLGMTECATAVLLPCQVRRHTEASAEELRRLDEQEEQLKKAGASELAVRTSKSETHIHTQTAW